MEPTRAPEFLNVDRLLESSRPAPGPNLVWWMGGLLLVVTLTAGLLSGGSPEGRAIVGGLSGFLMVAVIGGFSAFSVYAVKRLRAEQQEVERIGELVQLRRWPEAAASIEAYLSRPARSLQLRTQALVYLAPVLARMERFTDAIKVQTYLVDENLVDAGGAAAMKIGRVMAMLGEDHLFDADRAISDLRRGPAAGSGALALVELYRDVKTGHPQEAIELFEQKLTTLRDQLGHRVADAYALAARAYDLAGREAEARQAFHNATLLAPTGELFRRYPDVQKLANRFAPAAAPPEAA